MDHIDNTPASNHPDDPTLAFPKIGSEWTISFIQNIIAKKICENGLFDFKEKLAHQQDNQDKERNRRVCCAFANTSGGFLIFGVKDKPTSPNDIIGVDDPEFLAKFSDQILDCHPPLNWKPYTLTSPITTLPVYVMEISTSGHLHHSKKNAASGNFTFHKRTEGGQTQCMSYDEIREFFLTQKPDLLSENDVDLFRWIDSTLTHDVISQFKDRDFGDTMCKWMIDPINTFSCTKEDPAYKFTNIELDTLLNKLHASINKWEALYFQYAFSMEKGQDAYKLLQRHEWNPNSKREEIIRILCDYGNDIFFTKSNLVHEFKKHHSYP